MADKYVFQSDHFKGDNRIQACADAPLMHIKLGDKGAHVAKIQDALRQIREKALKGEMLDPPPGIANSPDISQQKYDTSTRDAVQKYKQDRQIINFTYQQSADAVVGQMTIVRLDQDMAFIEKKKKEDDDGGQDFWIEIQGDADLSGADISDQPTTFFDRINNQPDYQKKHGKIIRIIFRGGFGPTDPTERILQRFDRVSADTKKVGRIVIWGISVGGRTAMRVASRLFLKSIPVEWVVLNDPAFDEKDRMLSNPPPIHSNKTPVSYFQTWSFTIDPSKEFHGAPLGYTPFDITPSTSDIQKDYDDSPELFKLRDSFRTPFVDRAHSRACDVAKTPTLESLLGLLRP